MLWLSRLLPFVIFPLDLMGSLSLYNSHPKNYGKGGRTCRVTGRNQNGIIRKYGLNMGRQAFRERAVEMGWVKYN